MNSNYWYISFMFVCFFDFWFQHMCLLHFATLGGWNLAKNPWNPSKNLEKKIIKS